VHTLWIYLKPGDNLPRRIIAMGYDYGILGLVMMTSGEMTLPLFPALVWVTVGNGIRFGRQTLFIAVGIALTVLSLVWINNPYWRAHPFLAAALLITVAIIPIYAFSLLARIRAANDAAEEASFAKSRFLAQASHDLRHPLHALNLLSTQLAQTGLSAQQHDLVRKIDLSAHTATGMLNAFLDVSIIETGRLRVRMTRVDVGQLLSELRAVYSLSAASAGVTIRMPRTQVWIDADAAILRTILQNLISNVIKHAPESQLVIGVRRRSGAVWVEVHDNGPGFGAVPNPDDSSAQGTPPSTGIGLSIVSDLAQLSGLEFVLEMQSGCGTSARLGPFAKADPITHADAAEPVRALTGVRVFLDQLEAVDAAALADSLHKWGCDVVMEIDTPAASYVLVSAKPDTGLHSQAMAIIQLGDTHGLRFDAKMPHFQLSEPVQPAELRSILMAIKSSKAR
jgi:signal transduction histidine kinase